MTQAGIFCWSGARMAMGLSDVQLTFHPSDLITMKERVLRALLLSNELEFERGRVALTFVLSSGSRHLRRALWFKPTAGSAVFAGELETETLCRKVVQRLRAAGKSVVAASDVLKLPRLLHSINWA